MVVDDVVFQYGNVYYVFYLPDGRVLLHSDREGSIDVTGRTLPDFQETFSSKIADAKLMGVLLVALVAVMFLTIFNVPNILLLILSLFLFVAFIVYRSHQVSEQEFRYRLYEERMTEQSKGD
jgi:hypothetical protein